MSGSLPKRRPSFPLNLITKIIDTTNSVTGNIVIIVYFQSGQNGLDGTAHAFRARVAHVHRD